MSGVKINYGDRVAYELDGFNGDGFCIGYMPYAQDGSVILLATDEAIGMPINQHWCRIISAGHAEKCAELRGRYLAKFGRAAIAEEPS